MASAASAATVNAVNRASCFPAQTTSVILLWSLFATALISLVTPWYTSAASAPGVKQVSNVYLWEIETCNTETGTCASQNYILNKAPWTSTTAYSAGVTSMTFMIAATVITFAIAVVGALLPSGRVGDAKKAGHSIYNGLWLVTVFFIIAWTVFAGLWSSGTMTSYTDVDNYYRFGGGFAGAIIGTGLAPITAVVFAAAQKEAASAESTEKAAPAVASA